MKYKLKIKTLISFTTLLIYIFTLTGCNIKTEKEDELNEKVDEEMRYVSSQILTMLDSLNNITVKNYSVVTEKSSQSNYFSEKKEGGTSEENEKSGSDLGSDSEQSNRWIFRKYNHF